MSPRVLLTVSSWRTHCLLVEILLSPCGKITISLWKAQCNILFVEIRLSPSGELTVFSCREIVATFLSSSGLRGVFVVSYFGLLRLDQSLLVMSTLRSEFVDYPKFVVFFWISFLVPIFFGGSDVTVRLV